ncbi:MAG: dienelactone hydrolase family protein [Alphaproteobacteria bacterium]|nr:dienelactone hydrolase family protein [Alphaproteobacteria bacterium]
MDQKIITLFDRFTHGGMNRRDFFERLVGLAGGTAAATALLAVLENNYARAALVPEDDPSIRAEMTEIAPGIKGYLVRPAAEGTYPAILVIHENRGLNPHIKDVTRRMAKEGFIAFGGDCLTAKGGTPDDADKARDMIGELKAEEPVSFSQAAVAALARLPGSNGKVGAIGFCWGGGQVNALAVADASLAAGVAYYGRQAAAADVPKIKAPLMLHYAGLDERINAGIAAYEAALKDNGKVFELHMYDGANHAFNNDTNEARYDKAAADLAWSRTVAFLRKNLG